MRVLAIFGCAALVTACASPPVIPQFFSISLTGDMPMRKARCASLRWIRDGVEIASLHRCGQAEDVSDIEQWFDFQAQWTIAPGAVRFAAEVYDRENDVIACGEHEDITSCDEVCMVEISAC